MKKTDVLPPLFCGFVVTMNVHGALFFDDFPHNDSCPCSEFSYFPPTKKPLKPRETMIKHSFLSLLCRDTGGTTVQIFKSGTGVYVR